MRESFEHYGQIAKDVAKPKAEQPKGLGGALEYALAKAAEKFANDEAAQFEIFTIQQEKQKIMDELKTKLKSLDDPEEKPERRKAAKLVRREGDNYVFDRTGKGGERMVVTEGELLTDGEWGVQYDFDPETVPRAVRKEYLVEDAKRKLLGLADRQILRQMLTSRDVDMYKKTAYSELKRERASGVEASGHVAEKMVRLFLRKLAIDHGLDFDVQAADVSEDVERKIDFVIIRKARGRGVHVEANETVDRLGVQFTVTENPEMLEGKRRAIAKAKARLRPEDTIEDLVLVQMNAPDVVALQKKWKDSGKPPGGPDKLLPESIKEQIFKKVLKGFYSPAELDAAWAKMKT